jgi:hypothetical protein
MVELKEPERTFAIIAVPSNKPVSQIHNRTPAILEPAGYERWLGLEPKSIGSVVGSVIPIRRIVGISRIGRHVVAVGRWWIVIAVCGRIVSIGITPAPVVASSPASILDRPNMSLGKHTDNWLRGCLGGGWAHAETGSNHGDDQIEAAHYTTPRRPLSQRPQLLSAFSN